MTGAQFAYVDNINDKYFPPGYYILLQDRELNEVYSFKGTVRTAGTGSVDIAT